MYDPITVFLIWGVYFLQVGLFLLFFPAQRSSVSICCKAGLVMLNSLNFCLSGKLLISPSHLKESLSEYILGLGSSLSSLYFFFILFFCYDLHFIFQGIFFLSNKYFYQLEANYFTVLQWFLPYIDMNQPWVYMCSLS